MNPDRPDVPWIDAGFLDNKTKFPPQELLRYAGQHIAWSWDGTRIIDSDPNRQTLDEKLRAAGVDPGQIVHDYVDYPDVSCQL